MGIRAVWLIFFCILLVLVFVVIAAILTVAGLTIFRAIRWKAKIRLSQQQAWRESHDEQGRRLPPVSRGICQKCGRYFHRIYYLLDGSRVCEECYEPADKNGK